MNGKTVRRSNLNKVRDNSENVKTWKVKLMSGGVSEKKLKPQIPVSDSRRVKDAIEGDYDFYSHEMSSDDNRNAGENRRLQVLEDWYNSFTDKEMVAYEDLFDAAEDHSWNIDLYFDEIKGQEDRGVVEQILSSYKKFDGIPMNEVRLVIALPHKGWDAAFGGDDYLKLLFVRTKGSESASPKVLVSPLDAAEIFNMFTYKGGTYRYNENIDLFAEDVEVRKNVYDSRRVKDSLDEDDYEEYLNELGEGLDEDEFIIGGKKRNMPYGTALRRYDKTAWNVGYQEWVRENENDEYLLQMIAEQIEEGYHAGYDPKEWDLDITVDGQDISEFNDDDKDLIYQDIAYVLKDGYDNYQGIETELSDGSIVYVDFTLNY